MFKRVETSRINQENVKPTIDDICERLVKGFGLGKEDVQPVGSTGKKLPGGSSGDIDLAIDQNRLMEVNGFTNPEEYIDKCNELAEKFDVDVITKPKKGWSGTSYAWPIANADGKQEGQYVQLDLVVTDNMKYITWGYHTDPEQELKDGELDVDVNPKAMLKGMLLQAIALGGHESVLKTGTVDGEGESPVEVEIYDYDYRKGLFKVRKHRNQKRNGNYSRGWKNDEREFISGDPDEIVQILFNDQSIHSEDIMTVKDAWRAFLPLQL